MKKRFSYILLLTVLSVILLAPQGDIAAKNRKNSQTAKNVIILIADGMGPAHFLAARLYSKNILKKDLNMAAMLKTANTAYLTNETADSLVTESAAAAGQMATGKLMTAKAVSVEADGKTHIISIIEMAKKRNMATGLATTSGITDATPAAFSAHVSNRYDEDDIAAQQIVSGIDVLMGGRKLNFLPQERGGKRKDGRDLTVEAQKAGYAVVETSRGLDMVPPGKKILGLFNIFNMTWDFNRSGTMEPSLAEMAVKTFETLSKNKNGFIAMIEGGRIDHAAHSNDTACMIHEVLAFDEAVGAAMRFAEKDPRTLVIVTADHETGGLALIGKDKESEEYVGMNFEAISKMKISFDVIYQKIKKDPTPQNVKAIVKSDLSIELTDEEAKIVAEDALKTMDPFNYYYDYSHSLAFVLRPYLRVAWGSQTHTAMPLLMFATGPGSEMVKGLLHNTEVFNIVKKALDLK
jgi:alkaline phosphatase